MMKLKRWIIEIAILSLVFAGVGYAAHETKFSGLRVTDLTASRAVVTDAEKDLASSATTAEEIGYLSGVPSSLTGLLDGKAAVAHKDTHDPEDGGDPLDTAAASEIAGVQAAAEGSAHSFARSDHAHQIQHSIADNHLATYDGTQNSGEIVRMTADGLESRTDAEMKTQLAYLQAGDPINMADSLLTRAIVKDYAETPHTEASSSNTLTLDFEDGNVFLVTLTENVTTFDIASWLAGYAQALTIFLTQDSTARTVDWTDESIIWMTPSGDPPDITTINSIHTIVIASPNGGTTKYGYPISQ